MDSAFSSDVKASPVHHTSVSLVPGSHPVAPSSCCSDSTPFSQAEGRPHSPASLLSRTSSQLRRFGKHLLPSEGLSSGYQSFRHDCSSEADTRDDSSSSDDEDSDWDEDEWPHDRPLGLPLYGCGRPELVFASVEKFQVFLEPVTAVLRDRLEALPYDNISTFMQFCQTFYEQRSEYASLAELFRDYDVPLLPGRYTCVGLSSDLLSRLSYLEHAYPGLKDSMYLVSCEEGVERVEWYCSGATPPLHESEAEHVMLCVRVRVAGRAGVVLMDPGYHVGLPMVIMEDGAPPHAASFINKSGTTTKTHSYELYRPNPAHVLWHCVKQTPLGTSECVNVVHVAHPFLSGFDMAERRDLVYGMKTLVNRFRNGAIKSGLYFSLQPLAAAKVTFFYANPEDGSLVRSKVALSRFFPGEELASTLDNLLEKLALGSSEMRPHDSRGDLWPEAMVRVATDSGRGAEIFEVLQRVACLLTDQDLLDQISGINKAIVELSQDN